MLDIQWPDGQTAGDISPIPAIPYYLNAFIRFISTCVLFTATQKTPMLHFPFNCDVMGPALCESKPTANQALCTTKFGNSSCFYSLSFGYEKKCCPFL